jgi:DNA-binding response OmpR family regulator
VKAVLRRFEGSLAEQNEIVFNNLVINKENYTVLLDSEFIDLPPKEFELLFYLAINHNKVFTRDQILEHVWGIDYFGDTRTVDVHVKRLREKLEKPEQEWQIKTVWGVGYKFDLKPGV